MPVKKITDFKEILGTIAFAARKSETVKIWYPKTEKSKAGWREVEPYCLATDTAPEGEHLVYGKDRLSPGHIFNGYAVGSKSSHCRSFIVGKIMAAKRTGKKFIPRKGWLIEF